MGSVATLPLSTVVDVSVMLSPQAPATPTFNQGLIVGTSSVIGSVTGANPRLRQYTSLAQIAADGFALNSPEYLAATAYFSQTPAPLFCWIGRQDLTAIAAAHFSAGEAGTNYVVGDVVTVVQSGASLGKLRITTIGAGGAVTALEVVEGQQGTLYTVASGLATTGGSGAGLEVDITALGETPLQAVQACRLASPNWYLVCALAATDSDHIAIGTWAQPQTPQLIYCYTTGSDAALNGTAGDPFKALQTLSISRAFGLFSTTQGGLFPNNIYSQAAAMGKAMGLNNGLNGSYFTMKFKQLVGIAPENATLQASQIPNLEGRNANLYLSFANTFTWLEQGKVASGQFFDEQLNLDMLASDYQFSCVDLLIANPAILQTNGGQTQILDRINGANSRAAARGFLSGGVWSGPNIVGLKGNILLASGTALPNGYGAVSDTYANQAQANRDNREAMPVYSPIIESGAVHSILIGVFVQQ